MTQPLTPKRRAAIMQYVRLVCGDEMTFGLIVEQAIKADRMNTDALYAWLSRHGMVWRPKAKRWEVKR